MSGFDVTMRSQAQVQQTQQFYDSQRYQMMAQTGQSIAQAPAMVQELSLRKQDADMRLALQQQEFQSNAMKLQAMTAIDQADLMAEQVRGAKLQNDAIKFDMDNRKEQMGLQKEQMVDVRMERLVQSLGGGRGMVAQGIKFDPQTRKLVVMSAEERAEAAKNTGTTEFNAQRNFLSQQYRMLRDAGRYDEADAVLDEYNALGGGPGIGGTTPKKPKPMAPEAKAEVAEFSQLLEPLSMPSSSMVSPGGNTISGGTPGFLERGRAESIAAFMVEHQDELHQQALQAARAGRRNMKVGETPKETVRLFLLEMMNSGSDWRGRMVSDLLDNGVISQEEAQMILSR